MKWQLLTIGKPALAFARAGVDEYLGRLRRSATVDWSVLKESGAEANGEAQLARSAGTGVVRLMLDERGEDWTTQQFVERIDRWELDRVKQVSVLIGGADGHPAAVREAADVILRLSRFTLQHELALVVFLEQLYRAYTVKRGEPYHR